MKILKALSSSALQSVKMWRPSLIMWILSLMITSLLVLPVRKTINVAFGKSMITERFTEGIYTEVFTDLGKSFESILSYFSSGVFLLLLTGFLMNVFFAGGLFEGHKRKGEKFTLSEFFRYSALYFPRFLVISLMTVLMVFFAALFCVGLPSAIVGQVSSSAEGSMGSSVIWGVVILLAILPLFLLPADYARARIVSSESAGAFKALGFGFSKTFKTFLSSYPLMLILMFSQSVFTWLAVSFTAGMKPSSGATLFLLFLISQTFVLIKIMLRIWRYGSVSNML
jgi:hypothetical protein